MTPNEQRSLDLERLRDHEYDLVVVGGGIVGAGVARDATLRGMRVALLDKGDFSGGTSCRSSKLIHGGLRYLEHGELGLVFESVSERTLLTDRLASHLVRPLPFIAPVYHETRPGLFVMDVGLWLYDGLSRFRSPKLHRTYRAGPLHRLEPLLRTEGLRGGIVYYDCMTDDTRLGLENVLDAATLGATCLNYVAAEGFQRKGDRVAAVMARDLETGVRIEVRTKAVVVAAGPWADTVLGLPGAPARAGARLLRPTKGVHIVVDAARVPLNHAIAARAPSDGRVFFFIPWGERVMIGTTDTEFAGTPDDVEADAADVRYLLDAANHYLPSAHLTAADVLTTFAGLRPLVAPQTPDPQSPSDVSREHTLLVPLPGFLVIAGGKYTTYRRMAAEVVDRVERELHWSASTLRGTGESTEQRPLPGAASLPPDPSDLMERGVPAVVAQRMVRVYGALADQVAERLLGSPQVPLVDAELGVSIAEIDYAVTVERARTLLDVLSRRTLLYLRGRDQALGAAERVAERCAVWLGWDEARRAGEVERYRAAVAASRRWRQG
jgi:glycerol-3-phosphate dehydrogenase